LVRRAIDKITSREGAGDRKVVNFLTIKYDSSGES
jgi:hypothetical protein